MAGEDQTGDTFEEDDGQSVPLTPLHNGGRTKASAAVDWHSLSASPVSDPGSAGAHGTHVQDSPIKQFWARNKPSIFVALSQLFAALMNLSARLLEVEGSNMHPIQVLLLRQALTAMACCVYGWWQGVADFPLGKKELRWLLCVRGITGFVSIYGIWYSMMYLPLADVTVITFLAPGITGLICYFVLGEPFTRPERIATLVALLGVVLIAHPVSLFPGATAPDDGPPAGERLAAVGMVLLSVLGAAGAFASLRIIGKRAHPLIPVNYFAMVCTVICALALASAPRLHVGQPRLRWITPSSLREWGLLLSLGPLGFVMQYLLTLGLGGDKSNRANSMVYMHMLFAVSFDRWVFGHTMGIMSFLGCAMILGSAITVVLTKKKPALRPDDDLERRGIADEVDCESGEGVDLELSSVEEGRRSL